MLLELEANSSSIVSTLGWYLGLGDGVGPASVT